MEDKLIENPQLSLPCHRTCVSSYVSKHHVARQLKRKGCYERSSSEPLLRRSRSSITQEFEFKKHCFICGEVCLPKNPKNPKRWRTVIQCRTANRADGNSFKSTIMDKCDQLNNDIADKVRIRINGAPSDLHAADAQYHKDCYSRFMSGRNLHASDGIKCKQTNKQGQQTSPPNPLMHVLDNMNSDKTRIWSTVELFDLYQSYGGTLSRRIMVEKVCASFNDDVLLMQIDGCASMLGFRDQLSKYMRIIDMESDNTNDTDDIVSKIRTEVRSLSKHPDYDLSSFKFDNCVANTSPTLLSLISKLVSNGKVDRKSLSISQSIQQHIQMIPNTTVLGLGIKLHHRFGSKELITLLNEYGYICTYDEVRRFRKSVAAYTTEQGIQCQGLDANRGPVYGWFDNYDLNVFTPNGKRETHAMAVEFSQNKLDVVSEDSDVCFQRDVKGTHDITVPRLSKKAMESLQLTNSSPIEIKHYSGPKKPLPPCIQRHAGPCLSDIILTEQSVSQALCQDTNWLCALNKADTNDELGIEWSGHMVREMREKGANKIAPTEFSLGPLIDQVPSHPDTVLTTLLYCESVLTKAGMDYIILCADMQLFKVATHIKWADPLRWQKLIMIPGDMHLLMSFLGCIGTLMKGSGLEEILVSAYSGVSNMLSGKAWPKALRGYRMVTAALLTPLLEGDDKTYEEIHEGLETARRHPTGRLWVDGLITPTIIAHLFIRAQREGNWLLRMHCLKRMLGYFFAAGHWQYARYISWHMVEMDFALPASVKADFLNGSHVCRHSRGSWNAVPLDQYGEQTYIRYGKSKGGLVGLTLSPNQVHEWVMSYHICHQVSILMDQMCDNSTSCETAPDTKCQHKEEGRRRAMLDKEDRGKIKEHLSKFPNPLSTDCEKLFNIVNGMVATEDINVHKVTEIGDQMASSFIDSLPADFHTPVKRKIQTMEKLKRGIKVGSSTIYDLQTVYARLLIISQHRSVCLKDIFQYELCAVPSALFDEYGDMRTGNKAILADKLPASFVDSVHPDVEIVDGNALIYHSIWPKGGTVQNLADNMVKRIGTTNYRVLIVFDRYWENSTKSHERQRRVSSVAPYQLKLTINTKLPSRDAVMHSTENKKQLISLLFRCSMGENIIVIDEVNAEYHHEEADVTMVSYVLHHAQQGSENIVVLSDDTDVLVLLLYWFWKTQLKAKLYLKHFNNKLININDTANSLGDKCLPLLAVHAITGCDTSSFLFGQGKAKALRELMKNDWTKIDEVFGEGSAAHGDLIHCGRSFLSALYGEPKTETMNELRFNIFMKRKSGPPNIKMLPPTDANVAFHIRRAHLQTLIWKAADKQHAPNVDVTSFGWEREGENLRPFIYKSPPAPPELMKIISCSCQAQSACSTARWNCNQSGISCTTYCLCAAGENCNSQFTIHEEDDGGNEEPVSDESDEDEM